MDIERDLPTRSNSNVKSVSETEPNSLPTNAKRPSWWSPVFSGLVIDETAKHRNRMGPAIWLFLYLVTYAKRTTGMVHRTPKNIIEDTGIPERTVHRFLHQLVKQGYIEIVESKPSLKIQITKWKQMRRKIPADGD